MKGRLALVRQVGLHLMPFVLLTLGVMAALQGWQLPYFGAVRDQPHDRLVHVDPGGPAERAGLRVGDVLLTVDGVPIDARSPLWGDKRPGEPVTVRFLRAGEIHTTPVILAPLPPREQALRLSLLLIAFGFWLTGTVVWFLRPRQPDACRFYLQSLSGATVLTLLPLASTQVGWAMRLSGVAAVWAATLLIDLHSLFPVRLSRFRRRMGVVYAISGLLTLMYLVWDPLARANSRWGLRMSNALLLYFLAAVLTGVVLLARAYWRAPGGTVRRRVRLVLAGTVLGLLPPCLLIFVPLLVGWSSPVPDAVALLSLIHIPLAYAYGIYRYNLMGIDFLINRMAVYLTLGLLLIVVYFAVALVILALTGTAGLLAGALASLVAVALVVPLRRRVDLAWERIFYPDVYGYRGVVDRVSRRLVQALDYEHLGRLLVRDLCDAMDLEGAALLLVQEQHLVLQEATGTLRALGRQGAVLLADETLVRHLIQVGAPVAMEALPVVELSHPAIHLWVPLILAGELQGVLLLGAKRTDEFFSPQDRRLLGMLAGQAALAAQNVRLVAELQARMDELARDRHELQAAYRHLARSREDERRRVAAELHDDVIQPLAALNMEIARYAKAAGGEVGQGLRDLGRRVAGIVKVIRRVCAGLRPPVLDWGLVPTLRSHLRAFREETGLEVELVYDEVPKLSEEEEVLLFRLVQEALNNVRRHAQASTVHVCLAVTSAGLELSVTDDGIGFRTSGAGDGGPARSQADPAAPAGLEEHFGLRFMREYVEALGGQLRVDSRPGQGTTVTAWVPWVDDAPHTPDDEQQVGGSCAPGRPTLSDAARQRLSPSSIPRPPLPEDNTVPKKEPR